MNQKWMIAGMLTLALVSTGCSNQANLGTNANAASEAENAAKVTASNEAQTGTENGISNKEGVSKKVAIGKYGKVKKIIGNSVTIALGEVPENLKKGERSSDGETSKTADKGKTESEAPGGEPPAGGPPAGGGAPPSGGGGGPTGSGGGATGGSSGMKGNFGLNTEEIKLTGEVVELLIPVGVKIVTTGTSGMKEIDFADIIQGDTIALYYVEGTENIQRVVITPSTSD